MSILPTGLPEPVPSADGLDAPFWEGTRRQELWIQRCALCSTWQWGPEWMCHSCQSLDVGWDQVPSVTGRVYSWERVWHPVHPALASSCPYTIVLVELPQAGGVRLIGNLLGDPLQQIEIGDEVVGEFDPHDDANVPFTLIQWRSKKE